MASRGAGLDGSKPLSGLSSGGDECASCSISLPDDTSSKLPAGAPGSPRKDGTSRNGSPLLRSKEAIHACGNEVLDYENDHVRLDSNPPASFESHGSAPSCHTHTLTYISTAAPADSNTFSMLRRATIRTLSGEQLPRGQTLGPLWFGDSLTGYTIGYKFRLADAHARGRQRYYAMIALVGSDARRAFEAGAYIWAFFEQIAVHIIQTAERVARRNTVAGDNVAEKREFTPISSFLTGRTVDPDGFPRRIGAANVRASGLAELVGNENFFFELHKNFVVSLQNLGRLFDGMTFEPPVAESEAGSSSDGSSPEQETGRGVEDEEQTSMVPSKLGRPSENARQKMTQIRMPVCSTTVLPHRHQVAV
ncbi:hypothetical protein MMC24_004581 [Lignoscripta atroalba]|nr:hypothetical protein [Lignoscripta atroalba]